MKIYSFNRLIRKYSVNFILHTSQGKFVSGKWEKTDDSTVEMSGAIVPMSDKKIYSSGGVYTAQDRELYLTTPLKGSLSDFKVVYKENIYTVEESRDFEDYADVAVYALKWVSKA